MLIHSLQLHLMPVGSFKHSERETDGAERECERVKVQVSTLGSLQVTYSPHTLGPKGGKEFPGMQPSQFRSQQLGMQSLSLHQPEVRNRNRTHSPEGVLNRLIECLNIYLLGRN